MSDQTIDSHRQAAPAPEKKGSGCRTAAIILGVLGLIGILVLGALTFWGISKAKDMVAMDPAKVTEMASGIADLSGLEGWEPQFGMNMGFMRMAAYNSVEKDGMLMVLDGKESMFGSGDSFEQQMRSQMQQQQGQLGGEAETTTEMSSAREDFSIAGENTSLLVAQSEGTESGTAFTEVSGMFASKTEGSNGFIYLRAPSEQMSVDDMRELLGKIQ